MSADNYGIVHRTPDGKFGLSMGFASDDTPTTLDRPYVTADTFEEITQIASEEYFEYGWSYDASIWEGPEMAAAQIDRLIALGHLVPLKDAAAGNLFTTSVEVLKIRANL